MPFKDKKKARAASREAMRHKRANEALLKTKSETVKPDVKPSIKTVTPVTDLEIAGLPLSLRFQLQTITRSRKILHIPDNIREREEMAVRYFRGY